MIVNKIHNSSMFILVMFVAIALTFLGCGTNSNIKESEIKINYSKYIKQNVGFDIYEEKYSLHTQAKYGDYGFSIVYSEKILFSTQEELDSLKIKHFNDAKIIIDNLINFNK